MSDEKCDEVLVFADKAAAESHLAACKAAGTSGKRERVFSVDFAAAGDKSFVVASSKMHALSIYATKAGINIGSDRSTKPKAAPKLLQRILDMQAEISKLPDSEAKDKLLAKINSELEETKKKLEERRGKPRKSKKGTNTVASNAPAAPAAPAAPVGAA